MSSDDTIIKLYLQKYNWYKAFGCGVDMDELEYKDVSMISQIAQTVQECESIAQQRNLSSIERDNKRH